MSLIVSHVSPGLKFIIDSTFFLRYDKSLLKTFKIVAKAMQGNPNYTIYSKVHKNFPFTIKYCAKPSVI